jgi:integrase/recombinase XerD
MEQEIDEFIQWKKATRTRVWKAYYLWLNRFNKVTKKKVGDISVSDFSDYMATISEKYDPRTVQFAMILIKHFFRYCEELGYMKIPTLLLTIRSPKEKIPEFIPKEEFTHILSRIEPNNWGRLRDSLILRLLWDCALRVGELANLNVGQMDTNNCRAKIKVEKSHEERYIFWSKETNEILLKYLGIRNEIKVDHDSLFIGKGHYPFYATRLSTRSIERYLERYGVRPHTIRHSKVHDMAQNGATVYDIHHILRHSKNNLNSTLQYLKWWGPEQEKSARKFL